MSSAFPAWRFRVLFQPIPLTQNVSIGLTLAYQSPTLGAWRGLLISLGGVTVSLGWTFTA